MSPTAIGILAGHVKWLNFDNVAFLVSDLTIGQLLACINDCENNEFHNNGLTNNEWLEIFRFELERRESALQKRKAEIAKLEKDMEANRQMIIKALEQHLADIDEAAMLHRELGSIPLMADYYKLHACKALADFR